MCTYIECNITLTLIKINCFRKQRLVRSSLLHLCWKFDEATYKIVNYANKILNQTLNIHIQNHLVECTSKKNDILISIFNTKTYYILISNVFAANFRFRDRLASFFAFLTLLCKVNHDFLYRV